MFTWRMAVKTERERELRKMYIDMHMEHTLLQVTACCHLVSLWVRQSAGSYHRVMSDW